jgi:hypothetical protein
MAQVTIDGNYCLLEWVTVSSELSLVFPWPATASRERLDLGVALIAQETTGSVDGYRGCFVFGCSSLAP